MNSINESFDALVNVNNETPSAETIIENQTIENLTIPAEETSPPQKPIKNLTEIIEKNKNKINDETEDYLKSIKDEKDVKDYIIKFRSSIDENRLVNVTLKKKIDKFKVTKIKGKVEDIEDLIDDNEIEFLELDQNVEVLEENIPFNIKKVKADSVWSLSNGSGVKVAVLDTGISLHDDLAIAGGISFVDDNYFDSNGHGTSVAGVIAALFNDNGLVGTAPSVDLYSVKIMQSSTGDLSNAIAGIEWSINNSMDIVSMSFGFDSYSQIFKEVLQESYDNNILLVAASGNNGQDNILYPAKYDTVIAVGATTSDDNLAYFSSYGFEQELVAPGVDINSTSLNNDYSVSSGTSLAAPHVAGVAALIKSSNNSLTNEQIRAKLRNDALDLGDEGKDDYFGYGLVQVDLETTNFTFVNESYFYEIFNISNYGLPNITYNFWLNGTGTIDDVDFMPGYYLANIIHGTGSLETLLYNVNENKTIMILSDELLNITDDYTIACPPNADCKHDRIAFLNTVIKVQIFPFTRTKRAECFNWQHGDGSYDACYGPFSNFLYSTCRSDTLFNNACEDTSPPCDPIDSTLGAHNIPSDTSFTKTVRGRYCYDNSSGGYSSDVANPDTSYYICSARQYDCSGSTSYVDKCIFTDSSVNIGTVNCPSGTICDENSDDSNADFGPNGANTPNSPCRNVCTGKTDVYIDNQKGIVFNYSVNVNNVFNGTTNIAGLYTINFNNAWCGDTQTIDVYCSNNQTKKCEQKTTSMDFNGDNDSLVFNCNICTNDKNLEISLDDINYKQVSGNNFDFNITITNQNAAGSFNVMIKPQDKNTGLAGAGTIKAESISSSQSTYNSIISNVDTTNADYLHVYVDVNNTIPEAVETDNYVIVPFVRVKPKAYLVVSTGNSKADEAIKGYLKLFVQEVAENQAELVIAVGNPNFNSKVNQWNSYTGGLFRWHFDKTKNVPVFNYQPLDKLPYTGLVGRFINSSFSNLIFAYGTGIEGDLAAVKTLVSGKNIFFSPVVLGTHYEVVIDKYNLVGLSVMDLMHNNENHPYYNQKTDAFKQIVEDILLDNNFEIAIKTVQSLDTTSYGKNTTLRIKHINSDFSTTFRDAITNDTRPIVFSGGLFNDLFYWEKNSEKLIKNLINKGRSLWEIEITGGPEQDGKSDSPNYNYNDTRDYYWPALIAGVQKYSAQNSLQYVGHSNGCGVALASINKYQASGKNNAGYYWDTTTGSYQIMDLGSNAIDTFTGEGCPGALNGYSFFYDYFERFGESILGRINGNHIDGKALGKLLSEYCETLSGEDEDDCSDTAKHISGEFKVSKQLLQDYLNNLKDPTNLPQVDSGLSIRRFRLYSNKNFGGLMLWEFGPDSNLTKKSQDVVVSQQDSQEISDRISATNSVKLTNYTDFYHGRVSFSDFVKDIEVFLNG